MRVTVQTKTTFWRRLIKTAALHAAAAVVASLALTGLAAMYVTLFGLDVHVPAGMLVTFFATCVYLVSVLWPTTAITEVLCGRLLKWPRVAQIPVSAALLLAAVFATMAVANHRLQPGEPVSWRIALVTWVVLLPALTIYWWILQVPRLLSRIVAYFHIQRSGF